MEPKQDYAKQLTHKKITRIALGIYYNMDPNRYIAYDKRCEILNQDGPAIRRATQAAVLCVKIIKEETVLSFSQKILDHLNTNFNARIFHLLLRTDNNKPQKSPLALMLAATSKYENVISIGQSTTTIIKKIKDFNSTQRATVAESRTRRQLREYE